MFRNISILLGLAAIIAGFGCGSNGPSNANSNSNANTAVKIDPANIPPGLSGSPLPVSANMPPGISANGAVLPPGKTPTPGIPSADELKKPFKPGKTPTPGIPDAANIRKMMNLPATNINAPAKPSGDVPMMKSNRKPPGKP